MTQEISPIQLQLNKQPIDFSLAGSRMRLLMSGKQTDGAFCMFEVQKPPGGSTPVHLHRHDEETIYMLEGEMMAMVAGENHLLVAGNTVILPRNVPHQLIDRGDITARYILVCTPAGFDDFVTDAGKPWTSDGPHNAPTAADVARMIAVAPRYGIEILH